MSTKLKAATILCALATLTLALSFIPAFAQSRSLGPHARSIAPIRSTSPVFGPVSIPVTAPATRAPMPAGGPVEVLSYIQFTNVAVTGEYPHTLSAIASGGSINNTELSDYTLLPTAIVGKDVLLIPAQELSSLAAMQAIGTIWAPTLNAFLARGGRIVVCDYAGGDYGILTGAGLMAISGISSINNQSLQISDPTSPLAAGVATPYAGAVGSAAYNTTETGVVVQTVNNCIPVVISKQIAAGHVTLIGHCFYQTNASQNQLVVNAVFASYPGRTLYLTAPNGGEAYEPGNIVHVTWTAFGSDWAADDTIKLEYTSNGGADWTTIPGAASVLSGAGSFDWDTTGLPETNQYSVRITFNGDASITDTSATNFTIRTIVPEYRVSEVYGFAKEFSSPAATTTMIDKLYANNFNIVMPEIRKSGDAYYNSAYEPWATDVVGGYDPLADIIDKAHAKNMQVYGWLVTYRIWNKGKSAPATHIWSKHPEWALMDSAGNNYVGSYNNLDPGIPGVEDYLVNLIKDIVTKYPTLDGINFDYIRYDGTNYGYNPISKARFKAEYGVNPPTSSSSPDWANWSEWKRKQITDLVKRCYVEAVAINPKIKMTADTIGWMGADPTTNFTGTRAYTEVCQDSKGWMNKHFLDVNLLMNYKRDWTRELAGVGYRYHGYPFGNQSDDYFLWSDYLKQLQTTSGRHCVDTMGGYMNIMQGVLNQWGYDRANGLGLSTFRYGFDVGKDDTTAPGLPVVTGYYPSAVTVVAGSETTFYDTIKTTMFQSPAPIPTMSWKDNPTRGYLFGQVTDALEPNNSVYRNWIYKATVTAVGPSSDPHTYTVETDATGAYVIADDNGVIDVPLGDYTITAAKSGFTTSDPVTVTVTAGNAIRTDFNLGPFVSPENIKDIPDSLDPTLTPEGTVIAVNGNVVTAVLADCIYIEQADRSIGMQVRLGGTTPPTVVEGDRVNLIGRVVTYGGERVLDHSVVMAQTSGAVLTALGSSARDLSRQPTSTALLVRCAGKVTNTGVGFFELTDGSGAIKVKCPGLTIPARNTMAQASGINSVDTIERSVRVRRQSDITPMAKVAVTAPAGTISAGLNLFSIPYVPSDQTPSVAFGGLGIDGKLFHWDTATQQFVSYAALTPTTFGSISPMDGYALLSTTASALAFDGVPIPAVDARISCPTRGWSLISDPFITPVLWNNLKLTDGFQTLSLTDAVAAGWIGRIAFTWDSTAGNFGYVGTGARGSRFDDSLRPWKAYWVSTYQDNLALIVPAAN